MDKEKFFTNNLNKIVISVICCILWGSAFPVLKISYKELNILSSNTGALMTLAGLRFFIASILIFICTYFIFKEKISIEKHHIPKLILLGFFQTGFYYFLFYIGVSNTSGMKSAIIGALESFFTVIVAHFYYSNDKIDKMKITAMITGFLGIIFANWGKGFEFSFTFLGEGLLALSCVLGALSSIMVKEFSKSIHPFVITAYQMFFGSIMMLIYGFSSGQGNLNFNPVSSGLLLYSALLSTIAFSLWFMLLKYNKAGEISLYRFIIPVSGTILSAIFLPEETLNIYIFISLLLVTLGIVGINKFK